MTTGLKCEHCGEAWHSTVDGTCPNCGTRLRAGRLLHPEKRGGDTDRRTRAVPHLPERRSGADRRD